MTFADLFEIYLERHAKLKKRSWKEDRRQYEMYLVKLAKKRLSTITRSVKSLNHKSPVTTAVYARLDLDPVRESIGKATKAILEDGQK